ncbi:hypothetical protein EXIGLDRAFT_765166, partial [Exidia glandulosa HHB12029]
NIRSLDLPADTLPPDRHPVPSLPPPNSSSTPAASASTEQPADMVVAGPPPAARTLLTRPMWDRSIFPPDFFARAAAGKTRPWGSRYLPEGEQLTTGVDYTLPDEVTLHRMAMRYDSATAR